VPDFHTNIAEGKHALVLNGMHSSRPGQSLPGVPFIHRWPIEVVDGAIGAVALTAALTQQIDLATAFPNRLIPDDIAIGPAWVELDTNFAGTSITAATFEGGESDAPDPDAYFTSTSVFSGAGTRLSAPGANAALRARIAEVFTIDLTVVGANLDQLTAGKLFYNMLYIPLPRGFVSP